MTFLPTNEVHSKFWVVMKGRNCSKIICQRKYLGIKLNVATFSNRIGFCTILESGNTVRSVSYFQVGKTFKRRTLIQE